MQQASKRVTDELERAQQARAAGNEGMARVCARRAAGWAARDYLASHGRTPPEGALAALEELAGLPGLASEVQQAAADLRRRVDEEFKLPAGVDLIERARILIGGLK